MRSWHEHWRGPGGGREVLAFSYPLILGQMTFTLQSFINRLLLTWYSPDAVAAVTASLFVAQVGILVCAGTGQYTTTFIAQYLGAGRPERVGPMMWQGIWFALASGLVLASLAPSAGAIFDVAGHAPALRADETAYARILLLGSFPIILMPTLGSFFAGRGATRVVLLGNGVAALTNIVLDYLWIFGRLGFPEGGVAGAAFATVASDILGAALLFGLMLRRSHRTEFATLRGFRLEPRLLGRLLRFGLPAGSHFPLELLALAVFTLIVGRLGMVELAATGIAFSLNGLVFMPMVGLGIGVSALVGRYQGSRRPDLSERVTWTAFGWSLAYMLVWSAVYFFLPHRLLGPYAAGADARTFTPVAAITVMLLRFIAVYSVFDMMNAIFAAGLRGAGDTAFPLVVTVVAWLVTLVPIWVACVHFDGGVLVAWSFVSLCFVGEGLAMLARYRAGRWRDVRLIERDVASPEVDADGIAGGRGRRSGT
jgi:MATE family multidrug resistance protein